MRSSFLICIAVTTRFASDPSGHLACDTTTFAGNVISELSSFGGASGSEKITYPSGFTKLAIVANPGASIVAPTITTSTLLAFKHSLVSKLFRVKLADKFRRSV